ncbi:AMP-binding protein [Kitasatospora viridis]|uniref:Acyl-CoA synthetase (AMP-forming)/AMP-acid ligase II n=1 Tax=Kitasatospora viridis TaxID=281105 RepID=A0A561SFZ4_9ACTN|nr:AMP-binding protein [Kitasatospora viridis]TWF73806.1 acyl-CoA synthetase (AMP-forming)/AMP-acid ligase II [Kitasatospora viridis]
MITLEALRGLVAECLSVADDPGAVEFDSPITVDSFALVTITHQLEERHGIRIAPGYADLASFTSVRALHDYLATRAGEPVPPDLPPPTAPALPPAPPAPPAPAASGGTAPSWWGEQVLGRRPDEDVWALAERAISYGELRERVGALAVRLAAEGVGDGSSVALCMPPSLTLLYAMLAAWTRGAQVMLIDVRSTAPEVDRLLRICEPRFLLRAAPVSPVTRYLAEEVPFTLVRRATGRPAAPDVCLVQATSGSTGQPKVIGRGPDALLAELERYAVLPGMPGAGDRVLLLNSVIHTMGLVGGVLHGLNSGAQMVYPSRIRAATMLAAARAAEVTAVFGVPVHFDLLARSPADAVPSLRLAVSAGEPLPLGTWTRFRERFGVPISPVYGTTETGIIAADLTSGARPPVLGRPVTGTQVRVVAGELRVRTGVTPYLWSDRADRFHDGWLRTFDRCDLDPVTGTLSYRGRADSVVTIGGLKVDLTEVEETLLRHPGVREAVVVFGDAIEAHVGGEAGLSAADLAEWCRSRLSDFKVPKLFRLSGALPRNPNGKAVRSREALRQREDTGAHTDH